MTKGKIGEGYEVREDLFDINGRLREIDPDYYLYYSYRRRRYEVRVNGEGDYVALAWPRRLSPQILVKIRETRVERMEKTLAEAQKNNERLDRRRVRDAVENAVARAEGEIL